MPSQDGEFSTTIGPDAVFKGELTFEKDLRLLGKIEGAIMSTGSLLIGDGATLNGDAKAGTIRLDGNVKGNLTAVNKVQLSASARLEGDLHTARLEVAEGAVLVGMCSIGVNGTNATSNPSTAPEKKPAPNVKAGDSRKR